MRDEGAKDFEWFVYNIFSASFLDSETGFVGGQYITDVCKHLTDSNYTMDVTGRDHFKSTRLYADVMWRLLSERDTGFEAWYFSYAHKLANYHLVKIKKMIQNNPYYADIISLTPAQGILRYTWDNPSDPQARIMTVHPAGLLSFKRGIHAEHIYVDDPFQDESDKKLDPSNILKINNVMKSNLISMVKKGGTCRVVGTPQTEHDFFFDPAMRELFKHWIVPAITDEPKKVALWPEWKTYNDLVALRDILGERLFNKEYMALPTSAVDSYVDKSFLVPQCTLEPFTFQHHLELNNEMVVAGFDIGQKVHPSHLAVWLKKNKLNDKGEVEVHWEQIYQRWLDGWEYTKQIDFINTCVEFFNIDILRYDNTRGEFIGFEEQGMLSDRAEPIVFNSKNQAAMAANFNSLIETDKTRFINDRRQINQILAMNNELKAIAGPEGHADSFWSNCLALLQEADKAPNVRWL